MFFFAKNDHGFVAAVKTIEQRIKDVIFITFKLFIKELNCLILVPLNKIFFAFYAFARTCYQRKACAAALLTNYPTIIAILYQIPLSFFVVANFCFQEIGIEIWHVVNRPQNLQASDVCENWHFTWNREIGRKRPSIFNQIFSLKLIPQKKTRGDISPKQQAKWQKLGAKINQMKIVGENSLSLI